MSLPHFFFSQTVFSEDVVRDELELSAADSRHAVSALRLEPGDSVIVNDAVGAAWRAIIVRADASACRVRLLCPENAPREDGPEIHLWQALTKGNKFDEIVQKSVELGVFALHPLLMSRCVSRPDSRASSRKRERWQSISEAAAKQSGRMIIPKIYSAETFDGALEQLTAAPVGSLRFMPWEEENDLTLRDLLAPWLSGRDSAVGFPSAVHFLIGPEGGISGEECRAARQAGLSPVSLGARILRTETAGPAVLAMLNLAFERRA